MTADLPLFDNDQNALDEPVLDYKGIPGLVFLERFLDRTEQLKVLGEVNLRQWQTELKRRVQHYGYKYDYKARRIDPAMFVGPLPAFAVEIATKLVDLHMLSKQPDQLIVNEYEAGQGITPHVDCEPCFQNEIATISLGSEYTMDLTEIATKESKHITLAVGSCLVFSDDARYLWRHGIKARKTDNGRKRGRRVSLTFRNVIMSNEAEPVIQHFHDRISFDDFQHLDNQGKIV